MAQDLISAQAGGRRWVMGEVEPLPDGTSGKDFYRITVDQNSMLEIETQTPAGRSGEFTNNLDPIVRLYDQGGNLVASNDNGAADGRNAKLSYKVPKNKGGAYYVEMAASPLTSSPTSGEYILSVKQATGALPPFQVTTTDPPSGALFYDPPSQMTVNFNDVVLLPTLQASDLTIDGVGGAGVTPIDGDTAVFSTPDVFAYNGHYYTRTTSADNWAAAETEAAALGGHLVTINDQAEQDFLKQTFFSGPDRYTIYWIGLNDMAQEGTFVWSSGEPVTYTNWGPGEPNNAGGDENAVTINWYSSVNDGAWNDFNEGQNVYGIIELNSLPSGAYVVQEGTNTVAIAAGAIKDVQNTSITAYSGSFTIDHTAPRIVASSIQEGDVLPAGDLTYTVTFSEPIQASLIDASDFGLVGQFRGHSYSPTIFSLDATGTVLTVNYSGLLDDKYTLTLFSNPSSFVDQIGLELDGEPTTWPIPSNVTGNGIEGGDFYVNFATDAGPQALATPLVPVNPLGSLIYQTPAPSTGTIVFTGDTDDFTINLDGGQNLTVLVHPAAGQQATIAVHDPSNALVGGPITGNEPGGEVVLQTVPAATAGTYTITIGDSAGVLGLYSVELTLNAAAERESHSGTPFNGSIGSAEDISSSVIQLGAGVDRLAVLGEIVGGPTAGDAYVVSRYNDVVYRVDVSGSIVQTISSPELGGILGEIAMAQDNTLYVAVSTSFNSSSVSGKLVHFSESGELLGTIALPDDPGETFFSYPYGFSMTSDQTFWIAQPNSGNVIHVDPAGQTIGTYFVGGTPSCALQRDDGQVYVSGFDASSSGQVLLLDPTTGRTSLFTQQLGSPQLSNLAGTGGTWFGDRNSGAARFDDSGNLLQTVRFSGTQQAQTDASGNIWVSNIDSWQLDRFDSGGNFQFSTFVPQAAGLVVVGVDAPPPVIDTEDFYSFDLKAGQSATIALKALGGGNVHVTLLAADGTPLALGTSGASNVDELISDFIATAGGTYYVKVTGDSGTQYSLVVTRNADFDTESNSSFDTAQPITATPVDASQTVLGHVTSERLIELNATDSGWWYQDSYYTGYHDQYNTNYFVGGNPPYWQRRNFFVFSIPRSMVPCSGPGCG
jgi:hypothetical protein